MLPGTVVPRVDTTLFEASPPFRGGQEPCSTASRHAQSAPSAAPGGGGIEELHQAGEAVVQCRIGLFNSKCQRQIVRPLRQRPQQLEIAHGTGRPQRANKDESAIKGGQSRLSRCPGDRMEETD